jgi:epoxyqueuosine reductase
MPTMENPARNSLRIKEKARELGFLDCGIAEAGLLEKDAARLENWLESGFQGRMRYMENHFEKRTDPRRLLEGTRSVIVVLQNYHTTRKQDDPKAPVISKYAYGRDYHRIVRKKLERMLDWMHREIAPAEGRVFVDSAPIMERAWGARAGLGWIGRHSLLLNRKYGSWFFLGIILSGLELEPDSPVNEYCGDCTRCVDACPTGAILPDRTVDSRKCISYLTIELKDRPIPPEFRDNMRNRAFGCDICQDACPWNHNAHAHSEDWLKPRTGLLEMTREDWLALDEAKFNLLFEGSAVKRAGFTGLRRNIDFLQ